MSVSVFGVLHALADCAGNGGPERGGELLGVLQSFTLALEVYADVSQIGRASCRERV